MVSFTGGLGKVMRPILIAAVLFMLLLGSAACATQTTTLTGITSNLTTGTINSSTTNGELEPITVPTLPSIIPQYLEIDPDTGLHMTGTPTVVDFPSYRLKVSGKVDHELSLTYDELRLMPKMTATPDLVCEGFFVDAAAWSGASLKAILEMAGLQPDAATIGYEER
jgi:DMSO/TMAO reductase YedYZ molybdopterin-dependent catalytic subunit